MQPIPTPQILDPDRILGQGSSSDHEARAERLDDALHQSCSYAQQLWHDLDAVRGYLLDSLPPDPGVTGPGVAGPGVAGPGVTDPGVAGPHVTDSGVTDPGVAGQGVADRHRTASASPTGPDDDTGWANWITAYAAVTSVLCGPQGDSGYGFEEGRREAHLRRIAPMSLGHTDPGPSEHPEPAGDPTAQPPTAPPGRPGSGPGRTAATVLLVLLALRGLRPRRRTGRGSKVASSTRGG